MLPVIDYCYHFYSRYSKKTQENQSETKNLYLNKLDMQCPMKNSSSNKNETINSQNLLQGANLPSQAQDAPLQANNTDEILEPRFLQIVCSKIVEYAVKIPNSCVANCFKKVERNRLLDVLEQMIVQLCIYGFADYYASGDPALLQHRIKIDQRNCQLAIGNKKMINDEYKDQKIDFYTPT